MSIVSLVIAPTLARMEDKCPGVCDKPECHNKIVVISKDSTSTAEIKPENENMGKLIDALVADKLIQKGNFKLDINDGKLSLNGKVQSEETNQKYKTLIDAIGNTNIQIKPEER